MAEVSEDPRAIHVQVRFVPVVRGSGHAREESKESVVTNTAPIPSPAPAGGRVGTCRCPQDPPASVGPGSLFQLLRRELVLLPDETRFGLSPQPPPESPEPSHGTEPRSPITEQSRTGSTYFADWLGTFRA